MALGDGIRRLEEKQRQHLFDEKGRLVLPDVPEAGDAAGACQWLTRVFSLDARHPIVSGTRDGPQGPDGYVMVARRGAPTIHIHPASRINQPSRLIEALAWFRIPSDHEILPLKADHCRKVSLVVLRLCESGRVESLRDIAHGVLAELMTVADAVERSTTLSSGPDRYEAAVTLRRRRDEITGREIGPPRYLVDPDTGEFVVRVSDLLDAARRITGSSVARGWLDGAMSSLGFTHATIDGHQATGRSPRRGLHARVKVFRGIPPQGDA